MDRNESNPGMVERQLDDAPMQGSPTEREGLGNSPDRDSMRGDGPERESLPGDDMDREGMRDGNVDRDSLRGDGVERESMRGEGMDRDSLSGSEPGGRQDEMLGSERQGGHGFDRPADLGLSRDTGETTDRTSGDRPRNNNGTARDW